MEATKLVPNPHCTFIQQSQEQGFCCLRPHFSSLTSLQHLDIIHTMHHTLQHYL